MDRVIIITISISISLLAHSCNNIDFETAYTYISIALELFIAYNSTIAQKKNDDNYTDA